MPDSIPHGFLQIPGFARYAIDENGTVISVCSRNGQGENRPWNQATRLKPRTKKRGYQTVKLTHNGRKLRMFVHRLVLLAFVGPCPDGMECRHLDGNPANNHVSNLAWGTQLENDRDKILHGTYSRGEKNGRSKLNDSDVLEIRRRAANGESRKTIANDFSLNVANVCVIILRKTWRHL